MAAVPSSGPAASPFPAPPSPAADAARDLYERHGGQVFGFCLNRLRNREEAEDATQATFLNAFRALERGVEPELESAWLFTIAGNVCRARRRSAWRRGRVEAPGDLSAVEDLLPARTPDADELIRLPAALGGLPETQRRALLLREWQGLSYREIAAELDLSQSAVETLLFRARRSLARGLAGDGPRRGLARLRASGELGSIAALVKTLFFGGGAKVALTAATVAATSVVAATPTLRHDVVAAVESPPFGVAPARHFEVRPAPRKTVPVRKTSAVPAPAPVRATPPPPVVRPPASTRRPPAHRLVTPTAKPAPIALVAQRSDATAGPRLEPAARVVARTSHHPPRASRAHVEQHAAKAPDHAAVRVRAEKPEHAAPAPRPKPERPSRDSGAAPGRDPVSDVSGRGHDKRSKVATATVAAAADALTRGHAEHGRRAAAAAAAAATAATSDPVPAKPAVSDHGRKPDSHREHVRKDAAAPAPAPPQSAPTTSAPPPTTPTSGKKHDHPHGGDPATPVDATQSNAAPADDASRQDRGKGHDKHPASDQTEPTPAVDFSASPT